MTENKAPRELLVTSNIAEEATRLFVELQPRTIALSGGSTPKPVYERLASTDFPWAQTEIFFGD